MSIINKSQMLVVPGAGLEPARDFNVPADFKSAVSTNFTTQAHYHSISNAQKTNIGFYKFFLTRIYNFVPILKPVISRRLS